jgi:hypothetical protein
MPFFAIERAIDHIAGVGQRGELMIKIGIVFNDEQAQDGLRCELHIRLNRAPRA